MAVLSGELLSGEAAKTGAKRAPTPQSPRGFSALSRSLHNFARPTKTAMLEQVNDFPLFSTCCKRPFDVFSDLYFRCVHYSDNMAYPNLHIACDRIRAWRYGTFEFELVL